MGTSTDRIENLIFPGETHGDGPIFRCRELQP
jgi:hypothetical protein